MEPPMDAASGLSLVPVAGGKILVTGLKGPPEEGWQKKEEAFASQIPILP